MRILDKYVVKELIPPSLISLFAFTVLLVGRVVFDNITFFVEKKVPLDLVLRLIILNVPQVLGMGIPLAVLYGTALAVNRLSRDSEITSMRVAGTPLRRIFLPIFIIAIISTLLTFWVGESVTPWANRESKRTLRYIFGLQNAPPIQENVFFNSEGYYFYVQKIGKDEDGRDTLRNIMIYETPPPGGYPMLITAKWATSQNNVWSLHDGFTRKIGPDGFIEYEMKFPVMKLNLSRDMHDLWTTPKTTEEMGFRELQHQITLFGGTGREATKMKVDWHFKLSLPLSCLIFALCAAPLSLRFSKHGSYSGILMAIMVMFLYWNNILLGKALGISAKIPAFLAGWSQDIVFGLIGLYLLWREE